MVYQYIACNEQGEIVKGKLSAASEEAVNDILNYAGYRLINLKPHIPFLSMERLMGPAKIKPAEVILLYRQLALLLESGINIVTSLELLREQVSNRGLKKVLGEVVADLRGGNQLSAAMSKHPQIFSSISCRTLSIGEQTGGLETMLKQLADHTEKELNTMKGVKGALMYPAFAGVVTVVVVLVLVMFVLPAFAGLYTSLNAELPLLTRLMMGLSDVLRNNILYIALVILIVVMVSFIYIKTPQGRYNLDKLLLKIPVMGRVRLLNELSRCSRSISLLFTAGLSLPEIMPLVIQGTSNRVMAQALHDVQQDMLKGEGLARPMAKNPLFLPMMVQMVKVGEESGNLEVSLMAVARNYETEAQEKTKSMISMIQPAMTLVIAGMVGLIAMSMFSAMFSMYGQAF